MATISVNPDEVISAIDSIINEIEYSNFTSKLSIIKKMCDLAIIEGRSVQLSDEDFKIIGIEKFL